MNQKNRLLRKVRELLSRPSVRLALEGTDFDDAENTLIAISKNLGL